MNFHRDAKILINSVASKFQPQPPSVLVIRNGRQRGRFYGSNVQEGTSSGGFHP